MYSGGESILKAGPVATVLTKPPGHHLPLEIGRESGREELAAVAERAEDNLASSVVRFDDGAEVAARLEEELIKRRLAADPIVRLAQESAPVKNGLLRWEHVAYQMAWKRLVNPRSEPKSVIYGGMGPDISTVLLATDATEIYGIDEKPPNRTTLHQSLQNWNGLEEMVGRELRKTFGFWWGGVFDVNTALMAELKWIGVDPQSIKISSYGKEAIQIIFDWAYPGEQPKQRRLIYFVGTLPIVVKPSLPPSLPKADIWYQKSVPGYSWMGSNYLETILPYIKKGGQMLTTLSSNVGHLQLSDLIPEQLRSSWELIAVDPVFTRLLWEIMPKKDADGYGWQLFGMRHH